MGYFDPPEDFECPVCRDCECEGCPGWEKYYEEPQEIWNDVVTDHEMTRRQAREMDAMILADVEYEMENN